MRSSCLRYYYLFTVLGSFEFFLPEIVLSLRSTPGGGGGGDGGGMVGVGLG